MALPRPLFSNTGVKENAARHLPRKRRSYSLFLPLPFGESNGTPLQYSCLENPMDGGAWWAAVHGVAQSGTRLKRLSSSSNYSYHRHYGIIKLENIKIRIYYRSWKCLGEEIVDR